MSLIKRLINVFNRKDKENSQQEDKKELKQYTQQELENAKYKVMDVYRVTLRRKVKTNNMPEPKLETRSILAIIVEDHLYMDIETGNYYEAGPCICELKEINKYVASVMPFRYYASETLLDKYIADFDKLTAKQFREIVKSQKSKYKYPVYDFTLWGINR